MIRWLVDAIVPVSCPACRSEVQISTQTDALVCPDCFVEMQKILTPVCDMCSTALPGRHSGRRLFCDRCLRFPRVWERGRVPFAYEGTAKRLVLALKHGDRQDLAPKMAEWMAPLAKEILTKETLIAPVPIHPFRLLKRKYNQAALLSSRLARLLNCLHLPDLLKKSRSTPTQKGKNARDRTKNLKDAFVFNKKYRELCKNKPVLLVDDVFASGATFTACSKTCRNGTVRSVNILAFAKVEREI